MVLSEDVYKIQLGAIADYMMMRSEAWEESRGETTNGHWGSK